MSAVRYGTSSHGIDLITWLALHSLSLTLQPWLERVQLASCSWPCRAFEPSLSLSMKVALWLPLPLGDKHQLVGRLVSFAERVRVCVFLLSVSCL